MINPLALPDRFLKKIHFEPNTSCWLWSGLLNVDEYGRYKHKGKTILSHRFTWYFFKGPILKGLHIDHFVCDTPSCCNPEHLKVVSPKENILRGKGFGAVNSRKTHCPSGHEYTKESVYVLLSGLCKGHRRCKICKNSRDKVYRANKTKKDEDNVK